MATIPEVIDYGARPSLRSKRVDVPGTGDLAVADAIVVAASTFTQVMTERKVKQDNFNYAMAKQEYLTADLANRERLQDDRDYETFDERYRGWMKDDRERILEKRKLTDHDNAIFNAEADLIRERGAAGVGEFKRRLEIDDKRADMEGMLEIAGEKAFLAPQGERNDILLTALDAINALEDELVLTDVEAERERQTFVQGVSKKTLEGMEPVERERVLRASLKYRKAEGPLDADLIRQGKGTGSIADFLHADEAQAMLDATIKENEIKGAQAEGYAAKDYAWDTHPGLGKTARRKRQEIYRAIENPQARMAAEAADARQLLRDGEARLEEHRLWDSELRRMVTDFDMSWDDLEGGLRSKLELENPAMAANLKAWAKRHREGDGYNDHVTSKATQTYRDMSRQERADFESEGYMPQVIPLAPSERWMDHITRAQAEEWNDAARLTGDQIAAGRVSDPGITDTQRLNSIFAMAMPNGKAPTATSEKETHDKWNRMWIAYDTAVLRAGGEDKLSAADKQRIALQLTQFEVYERVTGFDTTANYATMSQEQIERGYLPLDEPVPPFSQTAHTMIIDYPAMPDYGLPAFEGTAIDWLKKTGSTVNPIAPGTEPEDDVLTEAFFYLVTQGPDAAVSRLKGLPGY